MMWFFLRGNRVVNRMEFVGGPLESAVLRWDQAPPRVIGVDGSGSYRYKKTVAGRHRYRWVPR